MSVCIDLLSSIICDTSIDKFVLSSLVSFKNLLVDLLFSINESIGVSVMVKVDLTVTIVDFDQLLPVILLLGGLIMLNGLKLEWQSSS